ncbi:UNVERIFIED_CONTAM: hypothetical protein FKN15_035545 [Acipenser sinensis]
MKFNSAEEVIRAKIHDPLQIISIIRNNDQLGFLYMTPAVPKSSIQYDTYNLKIVTHEHINKHDYYTISQHGVTHTWSGEVDFLDLDRWEQEYLYHKRLLQIPAFSLFRKWKAFKVWRTNVRSKKINECRKALQDHLFIVNDSLRPAILNIREMCYRISDMGLCRIEKGCTYALKNFRNAQFKQLEEVASRLAEFRELVKEVARSACRTALLEAGYTPDDYFNNAEDGGATGSNFLGHSDGDMEMMYGDSQEKMTYTEQANKRAHCRRLTCFIRLADYLIVNTMHILAVNSVTTLLNYLKEQVKQTATLDVIRSWGTEKQVKAEDSEKKTTVEQDNEETCIPMYLSELMLETQALSFLPSADDFKDCITEIIQKFQETVLSLANLVPDSYFDAFTQPTINNKTEEKTCGDGPSLASMFEDDKHLHSIVQEIKEALQFAFDAANVYAGTFERFRLFYKENEGLDLEALRQQDHGSRLPNRVVLDSVTRYTHSNHTYLVHSPWIYTVMDLHTSSCFIRLADYLIVNTMHILAVNSVTTLLNYLKEQVKQTATLDVIRSWGTEKQVKAEDSEKKTTVEQDNEETCIPMYLSELMLETQALSFLPSADDFKDCITEIIQKFQETVLSLANLVPDSYFDAFTQPTINNKTEEKTCGDGPSLASMFEDDKHLHSIVQEIKEALQFAFDAANVYAGTFERFRLFYKENEGLDLEALRQQDHGAAFFGEQLKTYHTEHKDALAIKQKRNLGMLLIDTTQLKNKLIPSPLRCLEAINEMLPVLAKKKMDAIIAEAQDAQFKLEFVPTATTEYVNGLLFLDEIQERIEVLDEETDVVAEMYKLIDQYRVPTPPEDFAVYATLKPSIVAVRNVIDKAVGDRESNITRFCQHLDKDILELNKDVKELKQQAQIEVLDEETDVVAEMYKLIDQYRVPTPPEDFAVYATLKPSIVAVRNVIDKAVGDRESNITRFCQHLDKDILELNKDVKELKQQAQCFFAHAVV